MSLVCEFEPTCIVSVSGRLSPVGSTCHIQAEVGRQCVGCLHRRPPTSARMFGLRTTDHNYAGDSLVNTNKQTLRVKGSPAINRPHRVWQITMLSNNATQYHAILCSCAQMLFIYESCPSTIFQLFSCYTEGNAF